MVEISVFIRNGSHASHNLYFSHTHFVPLSLSLSEPSYFNRITVHAVWINQMFTAPLWCFFHQSSVCLSFEVSFECSFDYNASLHRYLHCGTTHDECTLESLFLDFTNAAAITHLIYAHKFVLTFKHKQTENWTLFTRIHRQMISSFFFPNTLIISTLRFTNGYWKLRIWLLFILALQVARNYYHIL